MPGSPALGKQVLDNPAITRKIPDSGGNSTDSGSRKMTVKKFCGLLHEAKYGKNDKKWFPRWIRRYASAVEKTEGVLPVTESQVIRFLQSLRDHGTPAG